MITLHQSRHALATLDDRGVGTLQVSGNGALNIIGTAAIDELRAALAQLAGRPNLRVPVVARLVGWCLGGGLEVALACTSGEPRALMGDFMAR
jgi:enoyl-CoA hydratase/carnithine racemase